MERLDLAADERRDVGQVRDRRDVDAVRGKMVARPVRRVDLDPEVEEVARETRDAVSIRD
jgi:hypothetical protein